MTRQKASVLVAATIGAAVAALSACAPITDTDKNYHGIVSDTGAPISTVSSPSVPAVPVTITGSGEQG